MSAGTSMAEFTVRSDNVDVEQIMRQIRMRIREKRGSDYTADEIRELANVRLERFIDPAKIRSGLLEEFRKRQEGPAALENFDFEDTTLYASHRLPLLVTIRRLLNPILRLFLNPSVLIRALHLQSRMNRRFIDKEQLDYEIMSNLVLEVTKLSIEVRNLRMRLESLSARLDFDEHRARALEGVVEYRAGTLAGRGAEPDAEGEEEAQESPESARTARRRRRRRPRRRTGLTMPGEGAAIEALGHGTPAVTPPDREPDGTARQADGTAAQGGTGGGAGRAGSPEPTDP